METKNINTMNIFRKDSILIGTALGIILPLLVFGILFAVSVLFAPTGRDYLIKLSTIILVSVFSNLFTMRYYLLKLKADRTGRGILLVTFVFAITYFVVYTYFIN
jgi:hypothetical protein